MRSVVLLCFILILSSCSKNQDQDTIPAPKSLEELILEQTQNELFLDALHCSDIELEGQAFTILMPSESALQGFLNDLGASDFSAVKANIGASYFNAWFGSHILPQAAKVENLHTAFIPTMAKNSNAQAIYMHWRRNKTIVRINGQWIDFQNKDLELAQGMIHEIDQVLNPATLSKLVRSHSESFSILERALRITGLSTLLNSDQKKYTFLAPNDQAFDEFFQDKDCGDLDGFIADYGTPALKTLIEGHLINGSQKLSDLSGSSQNSLAANGGLNFYLDNGNIRINRSNAFGGNTAQVLITDISCFNGSLNIIDEVLKLP